jgi:hypothetical protein
MYTTKMANTSRSLLSEETMDFDQTFNVSENPRLLLSNVRGPVSVSGGVGSQIHIVAHMDETSGNPEGTEVTITQHENGTVEARTEWNKNYGWFLHRPCKVSYTITVPENCRVKVSNVSGSIELTNVHGDHKIRNVSGSVQLDNTHGNLSAKVVSGKVIARGLAGDVSLEAVSGGLSVEDSNLNRLHTKTVSGSQMLESPLGEGPYSLSSVSGSIRLILGKQQGCHVVASCISGGFKSDLPDARGSISKRHWDLEFMGGGPDIKMKTVSGSMRVLSYADASAQRVEVHSPTREERMETLHKVSNGDLSVEEAIRQL